VAVNGHVLILGAAARMLPTALRMPCAVLFSSPAWRHHFENIRDRLRAVRLPGDVIDQTGGRQTAGVGQSYGKGYELNVLSIWLDEVRTGQSGLSPYCAR
jgi:hypothetical protein